MFQIVFALHFLEEMRIIHLGKRDSSRFNIVTLITLLADLKPNNIIFAKEDRDDLSIKIIDFGLARDLEDDLDIPISTCGTPEFTSPEVVHHHHHNMSKKTHHTPR